MLLFPPDKLKDLSGLPGSRAPAPLRPPAAAAAHSDAAPTRPAGHPKVDISTKDLQT